VEEKTAAANVLASTFDPRSRSAFTIENLDFVLQAALAWSPRFLGAALAGLTMYGWSGFSRAFQFATACSLHRAPVVLIFSAASETHLVVLAVGCTTGPRELMPAGEEKPV